MKFDITHALASLRPGAQWVINNEDITTLVWKSTDFEPPSVQELLTEISRLQEEYDTKEYQRLRQLEYPPITDYLDGIVKGDQQQIAAYIAACQAVKAKYPKPE